MGGDVHSLRSGGTAFAAVNGAEIFDYLAQHPDESAIFNRAMTTGSAHATDELVHAYDFSRARVIVDVAGGQGWLLSAVLRAAPAARGVLFDVAHVVESARSMLAERGVADRCELVAGSFFDGVPAGGDLYMMKWILHDWDDDHSLRILRSCRRAMPPGSRLAILETVMPERMTATQTGALLDMHMLVLAGGHERTETEYRALLEATGFRLTRIVATDPSAHSPVFGANVSVIEAEPA